MRISRRAAEERRLAMLNWFLAHPESTGEEAQRALVSGRMTGKKEISMSLHTIHATQREAASMLARGQVRPRVPDGERVEGPRRQKVRELAKQLQEEMQQLGDIDTIIVGRDGVRVKRTTVQEEPL